MSFTTEGFELHQWQRTAVESWLAGDASGPMRGTLEIFTGGGKTLIALECAATAAARLADPRLVVVVPTEALARQWMQSIERYTSLSSQEIGLLGAGGSDEPARHRATVAVLNTAAKKLPSLVNPELDVILVVDECHRAGAPTFSKVLDTPAACRLGLSATPDREEVDEEGLPLQYDQQIVGQKLGAVVHSFDLKDARLAGWLPDYRLHHHGVPLDEQERAEYEPLSRRIEEIQDELRAHGVDVGQVRSLADRQDDVGELSRAFVGLTATRKDLLYRAHERYRIAMRIVGRAMRRESAKILLFHERVDEATALSDSLAEQYEGLVRLEHSRLTDGVRVAALDAFRTGEARILVSVKSLIEGIDVPDADVGISVASSASVRQRVQSLGRVLRRRFDVDAAEKTAEMHVLYVAGTVDESIYEKEDWSDLTGPESNVYWSWTDDPDAQPERQDGPPASPRPTEDQEWERLGQRVPDAPVRWEGVLVGQEYSVDTLGTVTNHFGTVISNAQGVGGMVTAVRGRPGGRFRVTPTHRLVLVSKGDGSGEGFFVAGRLDEPFEALEESAESPTGEFDTPGEPGAPYDGPSDKSGGTFQLRQKKGGVIERKLSDRGVEFALSDDSVALEKAANAERVLGAWRSLFDRGLSFHVNEVGHAWYLQEGSRRFLADVTGGFAWPTDEDEEVDDGGDADGGTPC